MVGGQKISAPPHQGAQKAQEEKREREERHGDMVCALGQPEQDVLLDL